MAEASSGSIVQASEWASSKSTWASWVATMTRILRSAPAAANAEIAVFSAINRRMDAIDRQILALLVEDGRRTYDDIARRVSLSAPAITRRVERLRRGGALRGFTAVIDHSALGHRTEALVELFFAPGTPLEQVAHVLATHPEVVEAWSVAGDADA